MRGVRNQSLPNPAAVPRRFARHACGLLVLAGLCYFWAPSPTVAQEGASIVRPGSTAVTGFSGTAVPGLEEGLRSGLAPVEETFIDPDGATLRIFDLSRLGGSATGQLVATPPAFEATAGQIGQVFALTYDDGLRNGTPSGVANLYAGATALHGIRIVTPDADGDGRPERQRRGAPGAVFMDGQFGTQNGGGPGTIWKIDGLSGTVMKFANIETNSGPGIGDISFDPDHRQFFASDLDSGLVHRFDADGAPLDTFDHGSEGRPRQGMEPMADDGTVMDIRGSAFDTEDPRTWGFTPDERRVWALAYRQGRLYYAVGEKAEIWSVGIAGDGGFGDDARWELTVDAGEPAAVTDIVFDARGRMYLARRGSLQNRYDYTSFAASGKAEVLRYAPEVPDDPATESSWMAIADEYALGFPDGHRRAAGGIDLQYGYDDNGDIDLGACAATLVATGDRLRDNPAVAERIAGGGPEAAHGVQLTPLHLVRPGNVPPFGSWYIDFDAYFDDPETEGHVGDTEVWRPCEVAFDDRTLEDALPFYPPNPSFDILVPLCPQGGRDRDCRERAPDLEVKKRAAVKRCSLAGGCDFTITVTNVGDAPYHGKIVLDEVTLPSGSTLDSGPNAPWVCVPSASPLSCTHPHTALEPGDSVQLTLGFKPAADWQGPSFANCVRYAYKASGKPVFGRTDNDRACARIPLCRRGDNSRFCRPSDEKRSDLMLKKRARAPVCSAGGVCTFVVDIVNNGAATYSGPLTVTDSYPLGAPASSTFSPAPPWTCGPEGPGQFRCHHPAVVLVPGASTSIMVKAGLPDGYDRNMVTNCAAVEPVPGEVDLANNKACASVRVPRKNPGQPALRITKTCAPAAAGTGVSCRIAVANLGAAHPVGPVRVHDVARLVGTGAPVQIRSVAPDGPEWNCDALPAVALSCAIPGTLLTPGATRHFDVIVSGSGRFENCARGAYGPAPGDDIVTPFGRACALGGSESPIRVEKIGDRECRIGQPCAFRITLTNDSDTPFSAPMRFGDAVGIDGVGRLEGVTIERLSPSFGCAEPAATLPLSCAAPLILGPHESRSFDMTIVLPDSGVLAGLGDKVGGENCVGVIAPGTPVRAGLGGGGADATGKAYACHRFSLVRDVPKTCSPGFVMNDRGGCVCPQGTSFRNGRCAPQSPPEPETPKQCVLLDGQVRTAAGECVCPRATVLIGNACIPAFRPDPPPPAACTLLPGQVRTRSGDCVCPRGTELRNRRCRPIRTVEDCQIRGQVHTRSGKCVCPRGTEPIRGACRRPQVEQCPQGTIRQGRRCVEVRRTCPAGTAGEYPNCFRPRPQIRINPADLLDLIPRRPQVERPNRTPTRPMRERRQQQPQNRVLRGIDLF